MNTQIIVSILNDESRDETTKYDDITTLFKDYTPAAASELLWDTLIFVATHPRRGSVANVRTLDRIHDFIVYNR